MAKTTLINSKLTALLLVLTSVGGVAHGEGSFAQTQNSLAGQNVIRPDASATSLANSTTAQAVGAVPLPVANAAVPSNDRKENAAAAQADANKGKKQATATGLALVAAATPMLASIIPSVRAAGAMLMAKAAMEFAQAAADKKNAATNGAQKDLLSQNGNYAVGAIPAADARVNNAQLDKVLTDRGINSQEFADRIASGDLQNPEEVLRAIGETELSETDLNAGSQLAERELGGIVHQQTMQTPARISYDDSRTSQPTPNSGPGGAAVAANGSGAAGQGLTPDGLGATAGEAAAPGSSRRPASDGSGSASSTEADKLAGAEDSAMKGMFNFMGGAPDANSASAAFSRSILEGLGVQKLAPKQTIFMTAHRNFRSYGKWRKTARVARNDR